MYNRFFDKPLFIVRMGPVFNTSDFILYQTENCNWILTSKVNAEIFKLPKDTSIRISNTDLNYMIKEATKQDMQQSFVVSYPNESLGEFLSRIGFIELKI
jgi:hypothetical protein